MAKQEWTPGPWEVDIPSFPKSRSSILVHRRGLSVCRTNGTSETCKANARLIAAAPLLYDRLADVALALRCGGLKRPKHWLKTIEEVIAKVLGE